MFKKREHKGQSTRRKRDDEDDDSNDNGDHKSDPSGPAHTNDDGLHSVLAQTKERHALRHHLQSKRGVDAQELLQNRNKSGGAMDHVKNENRDENVGVTAVRDRTNLSTRVDALSSKTQLPTGGTIVAEEQRIWGQKHAAALEEYVQQKLFSSQLLQQTSTMSQPQQQSSNDNDTTTTQTQKHPSTAKEQLYRELAAQAAMLSGKTSLTNNATEAPANSSGDALTSGAATAIMEVILPIDDRIQTVVATAHAVNTTNTQQQLPQSMPYVRNKASAVPNRFRSSYNHHHPMVPNNSNPNGTRKRPFENSNNEASTAPTSIDHERPGFAVARQLQQQQQHRSHQKHFGSNINQSSNNQHQSRSTDDRVYQQFVKRQREQHGR